MTKGSPSEKELHREPPNNLAINLAAPNNEQQQQQQQLQQQNQSPQPSISLYDNCSPKSYISYSSAAYSSLGEAEVGTPSMLLDEISKIKPLRPNSTYQSSLHGLADNRQESFAGHGLLSEVLKMQSLLEEYQHALTVLEIEKADKQQEINKLDKLLKGKGETEERYKDEIWSLEISKQDLLQRIEDLSQNLTKLNSEKNHFMREEMKLSQELEQLKAVKHTWQTEMQQVQEQCEQDNINFKKLVHKLRVENDELSKQLEELNSQQQNQTIQKNELRHIAQTVENQNPESTQLEAGTPTQPNIDGISFEKRPSLHYEAEVTTLKESLEQAHEIIQSMQLTINKEREERGELDQLLREAQETIEGLHHQTHKAPYGWQQSSEPSSKCSTPPRSPSIASILKQNPQMKSIKKRSSVRSSKPKYTNSLCDELSRANSTATFLNIPEEKQLTDSFEESREVNDSQSLSDLCKQSSLEIEKISECDKEDAMSIDINTTENEVMNEQVSNNTENSDAFLHSTTLPKETLSVETKDIGCNTSVYEEPISTQLSSFVLPSMCNHSLFENVGEVLQDISLQQILSNHEFYGSLIKEPESYIYNSKRKSSNEKNHGKKRLSPVKMNFSDSFKMDTTLRESQDRKEECGESSMQAMTRTMIGDWMWKYKKRVVGFGKLENRHRRYFWIHPYSQTLYWNSKEPGTTASQNGTKSVMIESFSVLEDSTKKNVPPYILVQTPSKEMQIQCLDFEGHYAWVKTLHYLVNNNAFTQNLLPTKVVSENGKVILDKEKFSLLQKSATFSKSLNRIEEYSNTQDEEDSYDEETKPVFSEPTSNLLNDSTLINLSFNDDNFQEQTLLDFAAIK